MGSNISNKTVVSNESQRSLHGLEVILAGMKSVAVRKQTNNRKSETTLSFSIRGGSLQFSFLNLKLSTDLDTGLTELSCIDLSRVSQFSSLNNTSKENNSSRSRKLLVSEKATENSSSLLHHSD